MLDIKVEIIGLEKIREGLKRAPQETLNEVGKAVQKSTMLVWNQSLKEAPTNKGLGGGSKGYGGQLKQNIKARMLSKISGIIEALAPYSIYVHTGTVPHVITSARGLANKRTGQFFGKRVNHPGTRPNPFFKRAIERSQNKIDEFFKTAIDNVINKIIQ